MSDLVLGRLTPARPHDAACVHVTAAASESREWSVSITVSKNQSFPPGSPHLHDPVTDGTHISRVR